MGWWGIPTHYEYVARMVCDELHKIRVSPDENKILLRIAAEEAFKSTVRSDPKLAAVMWKEMKLSYPDIIKGDPPIVES